MGAYVTRPFLAASPISKGMIVKKSTSGGLCAPLGIADAATLMIGVAENDAYTGFPVSVATLKGASGLLYSDGTAVIAEGDSLIPSVSVAGAMRSGAGGIAIASTSAPATLGALVDSVVTGAQGSGGSLANFTFSTNVLQSASTTARFVNSTVDGFVVEAGLPQIKIANVAQWQWYNTYFIPVTDLGGSIGLSSNRATEVWSRRYAGIEQTIAAAATITLDPAAGESIRVTLGATAITTVNGAAGYPGEVMRVEIIQDATGSRTIAGFASGTNGFQLIGGAYTATTTANKRDVLNFMWDSVAAKWIEYVARAVNV